jgi:ketosteroid isomerase-like protein
VNAALGIARVREEIANVVSAWCWAMDERDLAAVGRLWAPDAVLITRLPGKDEETVNGRETIVGRLSDAWSRMPPAGVRHNITALEVLSVQGDSAHTRSYTTSLKLVDGRPSFSSMGRHLETYVRVGDRWLISQRCQIVDGWMAGMPGGSKR